MEKKKMIANMDGRFGQRSASKFVQLVPIFAFFFFLAIMAMPHAADIFGWRVPDLLDPFSSAPAAAGQPIAPDMSWFRLSLIVLLLNAFMGAAGYVLAGMLGPKVAAWAKQVLYGTAKSALIVLFIFAGFTVTTCQGAGGSSTSGAVCVGFLQMQRAISFTQTVRNTISLEFGTMTAATAALSTVLNITPYFRPAGIIGISFSLSPAFRPLFDALGILLSLLSVATGEWFVQTWLLLFIQSRMLSILLPMGLFLRAYGFPRPGDALIAIAVGFFFVYPFMLNVSSYAIESYLQAEFGPGPLVQSSNGGFYSSFSECVSASSAQGQSVVCYFKLASKGVWEQVKGLVGNISPGAGLMLFGFTQLLTGSLPSAAVVALLILYTLAMLKVSIFYILVVSIIIPLFILLVVLTFIKELAGFLGTQMDFSAFERLI
ncbi:MAG: hypothetical protein M1530_04310 [Candidatus Marsarchaeota archaeon]|nr:hypothetical protein [Candidatus Marsarchaeota archaeon]